MTSKQKADAVLEALGSVRILCTHCGELHWAEGPSEVKVSGAMAMTYYAYYATCDKHDAVTYISVDNYERLHR